MEIDSKPEVMDKLDRRLIQLKIEREAVKKEKDEASKKRLSADRGRNPQAGAEYADLEEVWKAEKATVQGSGPRQGRDRPALRAQMADLQRKGQFDKVAELQYGKLPQLEARSETGRAGGPERQDRTSCCAPRWAPRRSPRWSRAPPASR
jgi:ATP-dependent Clp protease ATP-binding subunit ClpB